MCDEYVSEELDHILLECPAYASARLSLLKLMKDFFLQENKIPNFIGLPPFLQIQFITGDLRYSFCNKIRIFFFFKFQQNTNQ